MQWNNTAVISFNMKLNIDLNFKFNIFILPVLKGNSTLIKTWIIICLIYVIIDVWSFLCICITE